MSTSSIPADVRERVIQAAQVLHEQSGRESMPTVDAVRRLARVDMNAASAVMREWRRAQTAQAAPVAVTVPEVVTQAHGAALVALWQTAQELANESLRAAQAAWETERAEADRDRQELAEAYERQAAELDQAQGVADEAGRLRELAVNRAAQLTGQVEQLRTQLAEQQHRAEQAQMRAEEIERRAEDLKEGLSRALDDAEKVRRELSEVRAAAAQQFNEMRDALAESRGKIESMREREAAMRAEIEKARADAAGLKAQLVAAEQSKEEHKRLAASAALQQAERFTRLQAERDERARGEAEAREQAAHAAGQLRAIEAQCAALTARLAGQR